MSEIDIQELIQDLEEERMKQRDSLLTEIHRLVLENSMLREKIEKLSRKA